MAEANRADCPACGRSVMVNLDNSLRRHAVYPPQPGSPTGRCRLSTGGEDEPFAVIGCRHCAHPAGAHFDDGCRCGDCPGWADGPAVEWSGAIGAEFDRRNPGAWPGAKPPAFIPYEVTIRPGVRARLILPADLTAPEAERLAGIVRAIAFPEGESDD